MEDEVGLIDLLKVVKKHIIIVILVTLIGIGLSLVFKAPKKYQSIGYYKARQAKQGKQLVAEIRVRYPGVKVSEVLEESDIIGLTTTNLDQVIAREQQNSISEKLMLEKIIPLKDTLVESRQSISLIILSIFIGITAGFIKEWWNINRGKL